MRAPGYRHENTTSLASHYRNSALSHPRFHNVCPSDLRDSIGRGGGGIRSFSSPIKSRIFTLPPPELNLPRETPSFLTNDPLKRFRPTCVSIENPLSLPLNEPCLIKSSRNWRQIYNRRFVAWSYLLRPINCYFITRLIRQLSRLS